MLVPDFSLPIEVWGVAQMSSLNTPNSLDSSKMGLVLRKRHLTLPGSMTTLDYGVLSNLPTAGHWACHEHAEAPILQCHTPVLDP